ncbi:MAG: hypothetical protein RL660_2212 [Bacteroidota bacterium]
MRKVVLTFLVLLCAGISFGQINLGQGLKLYLPLNGNATDFSGNSNNGIISGATFTADQYGQANSALMFDGIDDFIEVANSNALQISDSMSMCAKVYVTGFYSGLCQSNCIIQKGNNDFNNGHYSLRFGDAPFDNDCNQLNQNNQTFYGHLKNLGSFPQGSGPGQAGAGPYIQPNQWYCVVYTWDGDTIKMFVDGVLRFKYGYTNQSNGTNADKLFIGKRNDANYPFLFKGILDDIRIYGRALNAAEVAAVCTDCSYFHNYNNNIILTGDTSLCAISTIQIQSNPPSGLIFYSWAPTSGISVSNLPNPFITANTTTTYTLTITDSNQCIAVDSVKFSIFSNPPVANAGLDATICAGGSSNSVQLNGSGGGTYFWQPGGTLNSSTLSNPTATPSTTTTYTLTVSSAQGCTNSDVVTVFVTPPPNLVLNPAADTLCIGSNITLSASGAASYAWQGAALNTTSGPNVIVNPSTSTIYTVTASSSGGCTSTATIAVTVEPLPVLSVGGTDSICIGETANVTVSGADFLQWSPATNIIPNINGGVDITPTISQIYTINAMSAAGCVTSTTYRLEVSTVPQFTLAKSSDISCQNKEVSITANNSSYIYSWQPGGQSVGAITNNILVAPLITTTYTVSAVNGKCSATKTIEVGVTSKPPVEYFVPNAFSPNDDGTNDCFRVKITGGGYNTFLLRIFNRWGQCVFESRDPNQCWYGEYKGIVSGGSDTYYYVLQIEDGCTPIKATGSIQVVQ